MLQSHGTQRSEMMEHDSTPCDFHQTLVFMACGRALPKFRLILSPMDNKGIRPALFGYAACTIVRGPVFRSIAP